MKDRIRQHRHQQSRYEAYLDAPRP